MKKESGKGLVIIIVLAIIIILVCGVVLYCKSNNIDIVAEIFNKNNTEVKEENLLSNEEIKELAIALAKEKYDKVVEYYWLDGNPEDTTAVNEENGITHAKIDNIQYHEIVETLSNKHLKEFEEARSLTKKDGKYYINMIGRGGNIYYAGPDKFEVTSIASDKIELTITEKYYDETAFNNLTEGQSETSITKFDYKMNAFTLVKENGTWKVDEFTLPM